MARAVALKLNLGCADRQFPGFRSVDKVPPADEIADLADLRISIEPNGKFRTYFMPWPWGDSSVDEIKAYDIFEHFPDATEITGKIHALNESWRVLKKGGHLEMIIPSSSKGAGHAQDPTHRGVGWCMNSFQYFQDGSFAVQRLAKSYCIRARFRILSLTERQYTDAFEDVWKVTGVLEAVK